MHCLFLSSRECKIGAVIKASPSLEPLALRCWKRCTGSFPWFHRSHQLLTCLCHLSALPNVYQHSPQHPSRGHSQAKMGGFFFILHLHISLQFHRADDTEHFHVDTQISLHLSTDTKPLCCHLYPQRGTRQEREKNTCRTIKKGF